MSQTGEAAEQIVNMATNVTVKGVECVANLSGKAGGIPCGVSYRGAQG